MEPLPQPYYPNSGGLESDNECCQQIVVPPSMTQPMVIPTLPSISSIVSQENHKQYQLVKEFRECHIDSKLMSVLYSEFRVSPKKATNIYEDWVNSLWFTPTGFKKIMDSESLKKVYIPFYSYKVGYNVEFSGFVTYDSLLHTKYSYEKQNRHQQPSPKNKTPSTNSSVISGTGEINTNNFNLPLEELIKDKGVEWKKVDGYITRTVNRILLLGCNSMSLLIDDGIMNCMDIHFDFLKTTESTLGDFEKHAILEQADVLSRYEPEMVWNRDYSNYLLEKEQAMSVEYLKQQEQTLFVKNVSSNVIYNEKLFNLVYIPFYYSTYEYQDQSYSFFLNAQNGMISANRPSKLGLGKIGDLFKYTCNYISTMVGSIEPTTKIKGDELGDHDQWKVYCDSSYFICFTRSATNLFTGSSNGFFVVKNNSRIERATLRGQKRRSVKKGNIFELLPMQERTFSFKGHWCLEIIKGEVNQIEIIKINHSNGGNIYQSIKN
ncbi:hypothetical protein DICPUDRAFT_87364 [Dictyostelium purpureum]|uniref:Uncharacterized protein n=1 Tax=Dictyostelium purpureum TaxID=5786 RepID=F0ZHK5_DICPU|nr:uncharacterized protein DICPUDRAFT_87364 [Dictyostelium purpureum]EGC36587.1 hypothetical protein DICPUDRAFT_87364 [Dictyostelium purpureum]|eukprot:XP_003286891.1 hypothetical protein DICPUDRAFT_87364 [Dictyostelium purpureum]